MTRHRGQKQRKLLTGGHNLIWRHSLWYYNYRNGERSCTSCGGIGYSIRVGRGGLWVTLKNRSFRNKKSSRRKRRASVGVRSSRRCSNRHRQGKQRGVHIHSSIRTRRRNCRSKRRRRRSKRCSGKSDKD